jgi:hypothetical protein
MRFTISPISRLGSAKMRESSAANSHVNVILLTPSILQAQPYLRLVALPPSDIPTDGLSSRPGLGPSLFSGTVNSILSVG